MQLVSFVLDGRPAFGALKEHGIANPTPHFAGQGIPGLRGLLAAGASEAARGIVAGAAPDLELDGAAFLPVIPDPDKTICIGLNCRGHAAGTGRAATEHPALFGRLAGSQAGHMQPMVKPRCSDEMDFEGELAVVIGTAGRHIPVARALAHVAGCACCNEGSVRDWQRHTSQSLAGKAFAGPCPWLVTAGVGAKRTPPPRLRAGDVVEVGIERIGCPRNPVVDEAAADAPAARAMGAATA